jgi:peptidoglycan hydrolase-like amidase
MKEKKLMRNWYYKKIMIFVSVIAILIMIFVNVNNASADYGNNHQAKPAPTPTPTSMPSGDTIRVYRSATGQIDVLNIETEYLPYVLAAENDIAPFESMKAQAVASRTFAYYKKEHPSGTNFDVYDDSRDQNYKPWLVLTDIEINSVSQTNGIVIKWGDVTICSFYVSGADDYAKYVTYNEGKSGEDITQSTIGWVTNSPSSNPYNRGAMGQIQANALADNGYAWQDILKYFYGNDIIIRYK